MSNLKNEKYGIQCVRYMYKERARTEEIDPSLVKIVRYSDFPICISKKETEDIYSGLEKYFKEYPWISFIMKQKFLCPISYRDAVDFGVVRWIKKVDKLVSVKIFRLLMDIFKINFDSFASIIVSYYHDAPNFKDYANEYKSSLHDPDFQLSISDEEITVAVNNSLMTFTECIHLAHRMANTHVLANYYQAACDDTVAPCLGKYGCDGWILECPKLDVQMEYHFSRNECDCKDSTCRWLDSLDIEEWLSWYNINFDPSDPRFYSNANAPFVAIGSCEYVY